MPKPTDELLIFLDSVKDWSSFAYDLLNGKWGYYTRGSLSANQIAAAERMKAKLEKRKHDNEVAKLSKPPSTSSLPESDIDLRSVPTGRYAVPHGTTRLKIIIRHVVDSNSNWNGWIFVKDAAVYGARTKYGHQEPNKLYQGRIQEQLRAIVANPEAALREYGKLTNHCGICNRPLEDAISVYNGIGPICADKHGIPLQQPPAPTLEEL